MMREEYYVELWCEYPQRELVKKYGPYNYHKADKFEDALDNRIDQEFYSCCIVAVRDSK